MLKIFPKIILRSINYLGRRNLLIAITLGFLVGVLLAVMIPSSSEEATEDEAGRGNLPLVTVQTAKELGAKTDILSLIGTVRSVSEATIRTETAGQILYVSYSLGDTISSGAIIAEIENNRERALLAQARAGLDASLASQEKTLQTFLRNQSDVQTDALNTYRKVFTLASDAIFGKTDSLFTSPRTSAPRLNIQSFGESTLEKDRAVINDILLEWERTLNQINVTSDFIALLKGVETDLLFMGSFLNGLATIVNRQQPPIDTEKVIVFSARSNINTGIASVSTAIDSLSRTLPTSTGGTGEAEATQRSAEANVRQNRAQVASALASLEKTIIRAPISGTLNRVDLKKGNFVGTLTPVVTIANNEALEIIAFASGADQSLLTIGAPVSIEGGLKGIVTKVAPALDPLTKKLEIHIGIVNGAERLINGDIVEIILSTIIINESEVTKNTNIRVPLSALKLTADSAFLFSVSDDMTLVAHKVEIGRVVSDQIEISGIDRNLPIVIDARGLREGQKVELNTL